MSEASNVKAKIEEKFETVKGGARKGYLAYLGLIGKAVEKGQDTVEDFGAKRAELRSKAELEINHLAARGETLLNDAQSKFDELTEEQKAALEERLQPIREGLDKLKSRISGEAKAAA